MTYIDILSKLISFNTTTAIDTLDAVNWVQHYLTMCGMTVRLINNPTGTRASVVATYTGNPTDKTTLFCGHLDVVPATADTWDTDPFTMTEKDGRLFGRGTADMKGGIAVLLSFVPTLIKRNKNFAVILTHNEEVGGNGIREVLSNPSTQALLQNAAGCMVLEPTSSQLVLGHKTATCSTIEIYGKPAHSSNPKLAVNALFHATEIYKLFYTTATQFTQHSDADFEVPYSVADILIFNSGNAINIMPEKASITYTCRFISEKTEQLFLTELEKQITTYVTDVSGLSVRFGDVIHLPALETSEQSNFVQHVLTEFAFASYKKASFATEAGHFSLRGIPTVVCGPGNIDNAHQNNEFIERDQLALFYEKLNRLYV